MSRALHSTLVSDQRVAAAYRKTVDADAADDLFLCKQNTILKNLFDDAWKFNGSFSQRHCKPLQGNGSATVSAHVRCRLQNSPASGSKES
jgi:hypothetical protein